jgi:hypothetical protein
MPWTLNPSGLQKPEWTRPKPETLSLRDASEHVVGRRN